MEIFGNTSFTSNPSYCLSIIFQMSSEEKSFPAVVEHAEHADSVLFDSPEEVAAQKSLVRKLDILILPLLSLSYLMAYIVR